MSMRYCSFTEYGMVLSCEDLENIKKWFVEKGKLEDDADYWEIIEASSYSIESISEFTGETYSLDKRGYFNIEDNSYDSEFIFYIPFGFMYPNVYEKVAEDYDDLEFKCVQKFYELKNRHDWFEALDFVTREDVMKRIKYITGVYYG